MGIFSGIENATFFAKSKNIPAGTHVLSGKKISVAASQKNRGVTNFIMEFDVVSTTSGEIAQGDVVSIVYPSSKVSFLGNVKYVVANYMLASERSVDPSTTAEQVNSKIDEDYLDAITDGDGTLYAGFEVKCVGTDTIIKTGPNAGQPFTRLDWYQIDDATPNSVPAAPF